MRKLHHSTVTAYKHFVHEHIGESYSWLAETLGLPPNKGTTIWRIVKHGAGLSKKEENTMRLAIGLDELPKRTRYYRPCLPPEMKVLGYEHILDILRLAMNINFPEQPTTKQEGAVGLLLELYNANKTGEGLEKALSKTESFLTQFTDI